MNMPVNTSAPSCRPDVAPSISVAPFHRAIPETRAKTTGHTRSALAEHVYVCVCRAVRASMRCVPVRGMCEVSAMLFRRRRIDVLEKELATQKERNLSAGAFVTSSCIATKEMTCR